MIGDIVIDQGVTYEVVFDGRQLLLDGERPLLRHSGSHQESVRASNSRRARVCRCERCKSVSLHAPGLSCLGSGA